MKNKNVLNDSHGFTLVELLAVIVVLAIVMLIAVQAVIPRMAKARKDVFALEADGAIQAAQTYFMNMSLTDEKKGLPLDNSERHVTISDLITQGYSDLKQAEYTGCVQVQKSGEIYIYTVWLKKGESLMVINAGNDGSSNTRITTEKTNDNDPDVVEYDAETWSKSGVCTTSSN